MDIPAFCNSCGTAFRSGIRVQGKVMALTLEGNTAGPCPKCGGMGRIPNGTFDFVEGAVRVLASPQQTIDDLRKLALILEDARKGRVDRDETIQRIEETVPALQRFARFLLANDTRWLAWVTALAAIITAVQPLLERGPQQSVVTSNVDVTISVTVEQPLSEERVAKVVEEVYDELCKPSRP